MTPSQNEIDARVEKFRQLIVCLNVLGRLKKEHKIISPKQKQSVPHLSLQDTSIFTFQGLWGRITRTFSRDNSYAREDNVEYVKSIIDDLRSEFTYLFKYVGRYISKNNEEGVQHSKAAQLMDFQKETQHSRGDKEKEAQKELPIQYTADRSPWTTVCHVSPCMKKDETRAFEIRYRLCQCKECILSSEQMIVIRICDLFVQALAAMSSAQCGLEILKDTYQTDETIITSIHSCQMDLTNMGNQFIKLAIRSEHADNDPIIHFARPYLSKISTSDSLP
jgi:hypothetical protein